MFLDFLAHSRFSLQFSEASCFCSHHKQFTNVMLALVIYVYLTPVQCRHTHTHAHNTTLRIIVYTITGFVIFLFYQLALFAGSFSHIFTLFAKYSHIGHFNTHFMRLLWLNCLRCQGLKRGRWNMNPNENEKKWRKAHFVGL